MYLRTPEKLLPSEIKLNLFPLSKYLIKIVRNITIVKLKGKHTIKYNNHIRQVSVKTQEEKQLINMLNQRMYI